MNYRSQPHRLRRLLVLGFTLFSLVVGMLGYLLYRNQKADIRADEARELSAIADLKLGELINWRRERESDAFVILESQPVAGRFSEFLEKPSRALLKRELVEWMNSWRKNINYSSVLFLDQRGAVHLSAPPRVTHISPATRDLAIEALLTRKVIFSDLYKDEITDQTCLDLLVPLLVPQARDTLCTGIIALRINPHQFLYPFIQSWPTPSRTGETLLLRREGNDVVYLNELRHRKNTALSLRLPLTDEHLPAAMGARGRRGIVEGFDYRGVPVLASIQEVPNSSWFLVAKVDTEESYELVWTRLRFIGGIIGLIILAGGITTAFIWGSRSAQLYQGLYESEKQRRALVEHYSHLTKYANDIILLMTADGRIVEGNDRAVTAYGYERDELLQLNISNLRAPETVAFLERDLRDVRERNGKVFETLHRRKDGSVFPLEVSSRVITVDDSEFYQHIIRDITERKRAEEHISRVNRLYAVLGQINQTIVRTRDRNTLLEKICRVAVEIGKFRMAWIGFVETDGKTVRPIVSRGVVDGYLTDIRIVATDEPEGRGPTGSAIREGKVIICNDVATDARMKPWRERMLQRGYRSSAAVPIRLEGHVIGAFNVYADEADFFDRGEIQLLEEIGGDITYALDTIEQEEKRKRAEEELQKSEARLKEAQRLGRIGHWEFDVQTTQIRWSDMVYALYERDPKLGPPTVEEEAAYYSPEDAERLRNCAQRTIETGEPYITDVRVNLPGGRYMDTVATGTPVKDAHGRVIRLLGTIQDITERKKAEKALQERVNELRCIADISRLAEEPSISIEELVQGAVNILSPAWQYPEICCARIMLDSKEFKTANFRETEWNQSADIKVDRKKFGVIMVCYLEETPAVDEGPFLKEERSLINTVADFLGHVIQHRTSEAEVKDSETRFKAIFNNANDGMLLADIESKKFDSGNVTICRILGYSQEEIKNLGVMDIHPEKDTPYVIEQFEKQSRKEIDVAPSLPVKRKDGSIFYADVNSAPIEISGKRYLLGIFRDITERKQAEEVLAHERNLLRALMDNVPDHIYFKDTDGHFVRISKAQAERFGLSDPAQAVGKTDFDFFTEEHARLAYEDEQEIIRTGQPLVGLEEKETWPDGRETWVSTTKVLLRDIKGQVIGTFGISRDITERKRGEDALRENEQRLRVALTCADIAVFNQDKDLRYTWMFNPHLGFLPEEVIGRTDRELFPRADLSRLLETKQKVLESGIGGSEEFLITLNQQEISVLLSVEPLRDSSGTILGLTGAMIDITERKLSQQRLEQERNLLRTLIDAIPDEIAVKDADRRFVLVNPACLRALGKDSEKDAEGKRDEDLIPEEHALDGKREEERILVTGMPLVNKEGKTRINLKTGEIERTLLISKIPLRDRDGKITGLVVVNRNITERKKAEVEIQRSRDWLNAILDASRDAIGVEKNRILVYANKTYARLFGYENPAELIGKDVTDVIDEPDNKRMMEYTQRRLRGEQVPEVYEFKGRRKDGKAMDLEAFVSTASIGGEDHIVALFRDISERKSLQKQVIEAQKMESIGTLAGGIAHDFNNILGIIMGHSSILEQTRENPEKFSQSAQAISRATFRGAALVRQLLTFARKTDVTMQSVLINDTLNELAKLLEETLPKTIVMELNLEKKLPSILAEPTQLHQVFLNLCVNARDAMMPKGGRLSLTTRLVSGEAVIAKFRRADAMEYIVVDVSDTGIGMDEATRSRIFEPFFTTKGIGKGTGLGLATVYGIVESHRGFIDVESTVGVGSTFHVYLPVEPRQVKRDELEKVAEKETPGGTETILVVEDEETLRDLVSFVLEGKGYRVLKASDGEEGLRLFTERMQDIALVLSDLGLPKISGEDLLKRVQQLKPGARVILASGYVEPGTKSELLKAGAVEIVQKPYVPVEILKKIREALDSKQ